LIVILNPPKNELKLQKAAINDALPLKAAKVMPLPS